MSFLRKIPNVTLNSLSILRHFATATVAAAKPFPDDPTTAYYDDLAADAGSSGDFHALRDVLNKRVQDGFLNTKRTFSFVTLDTLSPSLKNLVKTLADLNEGVTRRSALDSLVTRLCKLKRVNDALRVIDFVAREGICAPHACTFHPVLNHLSRTKSLEHARRVVGLMGGFGIVLDVTAHNYFLMAHCFAGDFDAAVGVLKKMEAEGVVADARTFDALVLGACRAGKVEGAMVLLRRMVDDGVPMLYSSHMYVINTLLKMECYEHAMRYVMSFVGKDKLLDAELLGCLASKFVTLKRGKHAILILEEMKQKGLPMGNKLKEFYERNVGNENGAKIDGGVVEAGNGV